MTLNSEKLHYLLNQPESESLDFKRELYGFADSDSESKFIKDILSFANTKRNSTSYIIIGVDIDKSGKKSMRDIKKQIDDSFFQSKIKDKVYPNPNFLWQQIEYNGHILGIFSIEPGSQRPYSPSKDFGILRKREVYIRRGSTNSEANEHEIEEMYFDRLYSFQLRNVKVQSLLRSKLEEIRSKISNYEESLSNLVADCLSIAQELELEDDVLWLRSELTGYSRKEGEIEISLMDVIGIEDENHPIYPRISGIRVIEGQIGVDTTSGIKYLDIPIFYSKSVVEIDSSIQKVQSGPGEFSYRCKAAEIPGVVDILKADPFEEVKIIFSSNTIESLGRNLRRELFLYIHRVEMIIMEKM